MHVDGAPIAPQGSVLVACRNAKANVPTHCKDVRLQAGGHCRGCIVEIDGSVSDAHPETPHDEAFDRAAVESVRTWRFGPATLGTTVPRYWRTSLGCECTASDSEQKITPTLASSSLNVVPSETESNTASTATPARRARSCSGTPSLS